MLYQESTTPDHQRADQTPSPPVALCSRGGGLRSRVGTSRKRVTRGRDSGSISIWIATGGLVMIILVGMAVDLGGQVFTQQHARDIARQASRAGGQQLQPAPAIRGLGVRADPAAAVLAARTYLAASDLTGTARVTGGTTVVVDTTAIYPTKFLSIIGITQLTVTGHAEATITRSVAGAPR